MDLSDPTSAALLCAEALDRAGLRVAALAREIPDWDARRTWSTIRERAGR